MQQPPSSMESAPSLRSGDAVDPDKIPVVTTRDSSAFQEVIYIERTSTLGDVVYIPQSTVFQPHCSCVATSSAQPMLVHQRLALFFLPPSPPPKTRLLEWFRINNSHISSKKMSYPLSEAIYCQLALERDVLKRRFQSRLIEFNVTFLSPEIKINWDFKILNAFFSRTLEHRNWWNYEQQLGHLDWMEDSA